METKGNSAGVGRPGTWLFLGAILAVGAAYWWRLTPDWVLVGALVVGFVLNEAAAKGKL